MADTILVLNAGSSSLKFSFFLEQDKMLQLVREHSLFVGFLSGHGS